MDALSIAPQTETLSILVIEDDALLGAQIRSVLEELRFGIVGVASTASEALSIAEASKPQLALVDARLHGPIGGDEVAAMLRHRGIPTIVLTENETQIAAANGAARAPVQLGKTFRPSMVFKAISKLLSDTTGSAAPNAAAKPADQSLADSSLSCGFC